MNPIKEQTQNIINTFALLARSNAVISKRRRRRRKKGHFTFYHGFFFFLPVPNNMWKWVARLESKPKHKSPGCSFKCTCEQISSSFYNFGKIQLVITGIVTHFKRHLRLTLSKKKDEKSTLKSGTVLNYKFINTAAPSFLFPEYR